MHGGACLFNSGEPIALFRGGANQSSFLFRYTKLD